MASVGAVASALAPLLMTAVFWQFTRPGACVYAPGAPFLLSAVLMVACVANPCRCPALAHHGRDLA